MEWRKEDYSDLPFDVSKHSEALKSHAAMNLSTQSLRPVLRVRELIFFRVPFCRFRIGTTKNPDLQQKIESDGGSLAFETLFYADSTSEATRVQREVESYFLRHFPGRTLADEKEIAAGDAVYVACYPPAGE